ncbi:dienelactone hydrolase family protein [Actinomadura barringtoniae]|uniref:Dienelactone hydrolase family protein n=1 Tax=Actinomadura barringtoniae TaxID=1427535 RepID=A0A939PQU5_9ACTN|nr:dienelactone hydrolase family protein [Actinomadura barringtoniae]MBO2454484.1 dienelactone hydrolase family protein [Actinomadura barringtoniae]
MCHSTDSRPPASPVVTGGVASHGPLKITAADGNRFSAYRATPEVPNGSSVVLLPDVRGLHPFYPDLAQRFAEAGFETIAIDYYGRSAGTGPRDDDFDGLKHLDLLDFAHVDSDVAAAAALLPGRVFTVGFCLGGGHSWRQAATQPGLAGAIGFYGSPRFFGDATPDVKAPILMLLAGDDVATPQADFDAMAAGLEDAGKSHEMHVYEGAPHSFFDRAHDDWSAACEDAWHRILAFTS